MNFFIFCIINTTKCRPKVVSTPPRSPLLLRTLGAYFITSSRKDAQTGSVCVWWRTDDRALQKSLKVKRLGAGETVWRVHRQGNKVRISVIFTPRLKGFLHCNLSRHNGVPKLTLELALAAACRSHGAASLRLHRQVSDEDSFRLDVLTSLSLCWFFHFVSFWLIGILLKYSIFWYYNCFHVVWPRE